MVQEGAKASVSGCRTGAGRWVRHGLALVAIGVAAASIIASLNERWRELKVSAFSLPVFDASVLVAGVAGTLILSAIYHVLLLRSFEVHTAPSTQVAHAYALGQIVRYVPGKVIGVVFQVSLLNGRVRPASVLAALLVQTVHDYAWTFAFGGLLLWSLLSWSILPLLALPLLLLATHCVHRHRLSQRLLAKVPFIGRYIHDAGKATSDYSPVALTWTLLVVWLPMLGGMWFAFTPLLGTYDSLIASLLYLIAAIMSLMVFVVPSGLVVREAVFLWLGGLSALPVEQLLFMAVVTRIAMTVAEIVTSLLLATVDASSRHQPIGGGSQ